MAAITQAQADAISKAQGINAGGAVGMNPSQLVTSYLGLDPRSLNPDDPTLQSLISGGFLDWGSDAQGNKALTPGGVFMDALNKQQGAIKPGSDVMLSSGGGAQPFGVNPMMPTATNAKDGGPILDYLAKISAGIGGDANSVNFGVKGNYAGSVDPVTGLQNYQVTGADPKIQMSSLFDRIAPSIAAGLFTLPISGPLMGSLGGFGSLFNLAGNELIGNKPNPFSAITGLLSGGAGGGANPIQQIMRLLGQ